MDLTNYQEFIRAFYRKRGWYDYSIFIRTNFLTEEVGEVCQAIRAIEIGRDRPDEMEAIAQEKMDHLVEELGDAFDNLFLIADKYDLSLEMILAKHKTKLEQRYSEDPSL